MCVRTYARAYDQLSVRKLLWRRAGRRVAVANIKTASMNHFFWSGEDRHGHEAQGGVAPPLCINTSGVKYSLTPQQQVILPKERHRPGLEIIIEGVHGEQLLGRAAPHSVRAFIFALVFWSDGVCENEIFDEFLKKEGTGDVERHLLPLRIRHVNSCA